MASNSINSICPDLSLASLMLENPHIPQPVAANGCRMFLDKFWKSTCVAQIWERSSKSVSGSTIGHCWTTLAAVALNHTFGSALEHITLKTHGLSRYSEARNLEIPPASRGEILGKVTKIRGFSMVLLILRTLSSSLVSAAFQDSICCNEENNLPFYPKMQWNYIGFLMISPPHAQGTNRFDPLLKPRSEVPIYTRGEWCVFPWVPAKVFSNYQTLWEIQLFVVTV